MGPSEVDSATKKTRTTINKNNYSTSWFALRLRKIETRLHDSLWGVENSKLDFMTRCGNWGLQKSSPPRTKNKNNKTNNNSTSWLALGLRKIVTRLHDSLWVFEKSKLDFMTRCGTWGFQKSTQPRKQKTNSTSWLALRLRKIETRLHDSLW